MVPLHICTPPRSSSESLSILIYEVFVILKSEMHEVSYPRSVSILHLVMVGCGFLHLLNEVSFSSDEPLILRPICWWVCILTPIKGPRSPSPSSLARLWLRL